MSCDKYGKRILSGCSREDLESIIHRLDSAIDAAASSLESIAKQAGQSSPLTSFNDVRWYARERAKIAREDGQ